MIHIITVLGDHQYKLPSGRLMITETPILTGARHLLNSNLASTSDTIELHRGTTISLRARVGIAALLTVKETGNGPRFKKWKPFSLIGQ